MISFCNLVRSAAVAVLMIEVVFVLVGVMLLFVVDCSANSNENIMG